MTPNSDNLKYSRFNGGIYTAYPSTNWYGTGNVNVPDGATFTGLRVYAYDNDSTNSASFTCRLYRRTATDLAAQEIATASQTTVGTNSQVQVTGTTAMHPIYKVVSESANSYYVYAYGVSMENSGN